MKFQDLKVGAKFTQSYKPSEKRYRGDCDGAFIKAKLDSGDCVAINLETGVIEHNIGSNGKEVVEIEHPIELQGRVYPVSMDHFFLSHSSSL